MIRQQSQQGFTTVELMITLFVGVMFILAGYQLYGAINLRSGDARMMSEASTIGYEVLRKEGTYQSTTTLCSSASTHPTQSVTRTSPTLPDLDVKLFRCRPFDNSTVIRVTVVVKYGSPEREVVHATYVSL